MIAIWALLAAGLELSAGEVQPLFEVKIDHDFTNPRETFDEVLKLIQEHYYTDQIDERSLWWGAIEGMLRHISPEENKALAAIWLPAEYEKINQTLHGVQESIGIKSSFSPGDGTLTVTDVMDGGPSESLLLPYDRIVRIDDMPLKGMKVAEVDALLKGEAGTRVNLKVIRDIAIFDILIRRDKVKVQNVTVQTFPKGIVYIAIAKFSEGVSTELGEELDRQAEAGQKGLILDLRGNSGGVFTEGLKAVELFVPKGGSLMRIVSHGSKVNNYVSSNETPTELDTVVLVDGGSASASEILAAGLRDGRDAVLIGETTYGKATMEKIFTLENKYRVKFTYAALYSPKGKSWQKTGLVPDFIVPEDSGILAKTKKLSPEVRLLNDNQLRAAFKLLSARIEGAAADAE